MAIRVALDHRTEYRYDPTATSLATPLHDVLEQHHGVCQDFAQVMIGALHSLGIPARYSERPLELGPRSET